MNDAATFLFELNEKRRREQTESPALYVPPPFLHPALEIAIQHRFLISPAIKLTPRANSWQSIGRPSRDRGQIELWVDTWIGLGWLLEACSPSLADSSDGVIALEADSDLAKYSLAELTDEWEWQETLRFAHGSRWILLFRYAPRLRSLAGYPGLRYLTGSILIPPSWTSSGELTYAPGASLLSAPNWLLGGPRQE